MFWHATPDQQTEYEHAQMWRDLAADEARGDEPETPEPVRAEAWALMCEEAIYMAVDEIARMQFTQRQPAMACIYRRTQIAIARGNDHMRGKFPSKTIAYINQSRVDFSRRYNLLLNEVRENVKEGAKRAALELLGREDKES